MTIVTLQYTLAFMIKSIKHKGLKQFWETGNSSRLPASFINKIRTLLLTLDSAVNIDRINIRAGKLDKLTGDMKDYWAISVNRNWRITFTVGDDDHFYDVDFVDYH